MDCVLSRSAPSTIRNSGMPVTRTILGHGEGIRLVLTCFTRSQSAQMSIREIHEWLAQNYPKCHYTKYKIRKVFLHDSKTKQPRFICYKTCGSRVSCRWAIRPEMEPETRQLCFPPLERESQAFQSLGGNYGCTEGDQPAEAGSRNKSDSGNSAIAQQIPRDDFKRDFLYTKAVIRIREETVELGRVNINGESKHNLLPRALANKFGLPLYSGSIIRIRVENRSIPVNRYCQINIQVAGIEIKINAHIVSDLPSLLLGRAWVQKIRLLRGVGTHQYYIQGPLGKLINLPDPTSSAETESGECSASIVEKLPTIMEVGECELGRFASPYESIDSATEDETISGDEVWHDTVSRQSTEGDIDFIKHMLAEKRGWGESLPARLSWRYGGPVHMGVAAEYQESRVA